jgi:hypothetical protein
MRLRGAGKGVILKTFTEKVGRLLTRLRFLRSLKKNAKSGDFAERGNYAGLENDLDVVMLDLF